MESLIISKKIPSAVRLHFFYSVSSSISEGSGYFKMQSSCEFDFTGTKKKEAFFVLSLSVGTQRLEIWDLCLCFDSVIRLVLADCQMSLLPNIVLRICLHISPEPTSLQI